MVGSLIEEVRSELGVKKRVQLGQVERKWEDHHRQWEQHTHGTDHRVGRAPLQGDETMRQREVMSVHCGVRQTCSEPSSAT